MGIVAGARLPGRDLLCRAGDADLAPHAAEPDSLPVSRPDASRRERAAARMSGAERILAETAEADALRREVGALRRALSERDAFLAGVAHELRNPMTPILGQVERLRVAAERDAPEGRVAQGLAQLHWLV